MTGSPKPMVAIVATNNIDEERVLARIVVLPTGEPHVLRGLFDDISQIQVILSAARAVVNYSVTKSRPIRLVLPDRAVVGLLQGEWVAKGRRLHAQVAHIRHLVHDRGAQVEFRYGTVRSALGTMADLIDIW